MRGVKIALYEEKNKYWEAWKGRLGGGMKRGGRRKRKGYRESKGNERFVKK